MAVWKLRGKGGVQQALRHHPLRGDGGVEDPLQAPRLPCNRWTERVEVSRIFLFSMQLGRLRFGTGGGYVR